MWCPNSTSLGIVPNITPDKTRINVAVPYAAREKAGGERKDASTFPKTTIFYAIIADGHPNLISGSRKCRDYHSIRWWMRLRRVIMG
jgi:hypothetical protein